MFSFYPRSLLSSRVSFGHSYTEIWLKGYYSCLNSGNRFYVRSNNGEYGPRFDTSSIAMFRDDSTSVNCAYPHEGPGLSHEISLHIKPGNSDGLLDGYLDGINIANLSGSIGGGNLPIYGIRLDYLPDWLMVADFDIADYHLAPVDIKDYETDFTNQSDGTIKATAIGQYISMHLDTDDLKAKMQKVVENAEIVGVNVSAFNVSYDSNVINALKSSIDGTDSEDLTITNNNVVGKMLTVNPALNKAWTLDQLKTASFKLTAEKV